jgi:hypothetical protein
MNAIIPKEFGAVSARFAAVPAENDLGAGVSGGYGLIGYKGKVWSTRYKGTEVALMREDGDGARGSIEVVILKASQAISKVYYIKGFEEGTKAPPDCFSANGLTPDPTSTHKQASVCASCPRNAFGSAVKQDGTPGKGKACSDSKRLAVVPLPDINNEMLGGPMLLRVPAASLQDVATYGTGVQKLGFPYYGVGTRIAFDPKDAYPKFVLSPIRPLTDDEADMVLALRNDPRVDRVLAETEYEQAPPAEQPAGMAFEQPTTAAAAVTPQVTVGQDFGTKPATVAVVQPAQSAAVEPPAAAIKPSPRAKPKLAPVAAAGGFGGAGAPLQPEAEPAASTGAASFDDALDAELAALMGEA